MKDLLIVAALILVIYFCFLKKEDDGVLCDVHYMDDYRRPQLQPKP